MKTKEIIFTVLWTALVLGLYGINYFTNKLILRADNVYEIYLDGQVVGFIDNDDELYNMINDRQQAIKKEFSVKNVYPPSSFQIVKTNSYKAVISPVEEVYNKLSTLGNFTIEGYIVSIKGEDKEYTINLLSKEIFDEAIQTFIMSFVNETDYHNYMNNTQPEIETTGKTIELMYFDETITIKKGYIGVDDPIYSTAIDLSQLLLFGENYETQSYKVKSGDTIASISEDNKLNPQEFLVANPKYTSVDSLLTVGDEVNITLIKPMLTLTTEMREVEDTKMPFQNIIEYDYSKDSSYSVVTTPGVNGVTRIDKRYIAKNGANNSDAVIVNSQEITKKVDQVTVKGRSYTPAPNTQPNISGEYVDTGESWGWPTNQPYIITSGFEWRWGVLHDGIDISGTGYGSPIYAVMEGTVYVNGVNSSCGWQGGECVVIGHPNGYYSMYAHMVEGSSQIVQPGQHVSKGQVIGSMGTSGFVTGYHLHFSIFNGVPYQGGHTFNPTSLWW